MLIKKSPPDQFPFLLQIGALCQHQPLTNLFTGDAALPVIGKYSRNQYHFLNLDVVVQMDLCLIDGMYRCQDQVIKLPDSVMGILNNIPQQIEHNKPPPKEIKSKKGNKKQNKKTGKQTKLEQYFEIEQQNIEQLQQMQQEQQQQQEQVDEDFQVIQFHPLQFKAEQNLRFTWTVSSLANKKILEPLKQEPCLSYVNHNWMFEIINFEERKKLIRHLALCFVEPKGVQEYPDPYKSLSYNKLRSEYMSVHLGPQGSLCFSPNNMKITVDLKQQLISFWTVILQEDGIHRIHLHWVILQDVLSEMSQTIAKQANNLNELITMYMDVSDEFKTECANIIKVMC